MYTKPDWMAFGAVGAFSMAVLPLLLLWSGSSSTLIERTNERGHGGWSVSVRWMYTHMNHPATEWWRRTCNQVCGCTNGQFVGYFELAIQHSRPFRFVGQNLRSRPLPFLVRELVLRWMKSHSQTKITLQIFRSRPKNDNQRIQWRSRVFSRERGVRELTNELATWRRKVSKPEFCTFAVSRVSERWGGNCDFDRNEN